MRTLWWIGMKIPQIVTHLGYIFRDKTEVNVQFRP